MIRRLWYRIRTREIAARDLKLGDRVLFDFPGTGPYLTDPLRLISEHSGQLPGHDIWISCGSGSSIGFTPDARIRIAR